MKHLKELRTEQNIQAKVVAEHLGILYRTYQKYETGEIDPPLSKATALADYFDVPLDYLVGNGVFANWELVEPHLGEILQVLRNFFPEGLDPASLNQKQILFLFQALFAKIEVNGNVVKLYPLLPLEGLKDIQIPSDS